MSAAPDPTMEAITAAVVRGREGRTDTARTELLTIWSRIGADGDALHRCTLAHYLADLYDHPAESLIWDVRALDAAQALTDERAQRHHADLRVTGFLPSLHLNMADALRAADPEPENRVRRVRGVRFHVLTAGARLSRLSRKIVLRFAAPKEWVKRVLELLEAFPCRVQPTEST